MGHSQRVRFDNGRGQLLGGILEIPSSPSPQPLAIFSHCFTCTKDLKAIVRISRRLAAAGLGVLRFDFTGLGDSQGDFSDSNFSSTCLDLAAAADFLADEHHPPQLLIGHSLGGAAALATAQKLPSVLAVVTIAAPSDTYHLAELLGSMNPEIERDGVGDVVIGGRTHTIGRQMLNDLRSFDLGQALRDFELPLLAFHSPADRTLAFEHAQKITATVRGPTSLVTIDGGDHLLVDQSGDVDFVSDMIAAWVKRYL